MAIDAKIKVRSLTKIPIDSPLTIIKGSSIRALSAPASLAIMRFSERIPKKIINNKLQKKLR